MTYLPSNLAEQLTNAVCHRKAEAVLKERIKTHSLGPLAVME